MEYLIIKDGIIKEHCCGSIVPDGAVSVTDFCGIIGEPVVYYNDDWTRKTDIELYKEKVIPIPSGYRLNDDKTALVGMTQVEKINARLESLPAGYKIENGELVEKTNTEKLTDGELTQDEYNAKLIATYKNEIDKLERQQFRSEKAILNALCNGTKAEDTDQKYFNQYEIQIISFRKKIAELS